jgi:CAF1 family ribonuclease
MDVTMHNFWDALDIFKQHLPTASFVAFDLEFTGLGTDLSSQLDKPERRYEMSREVATEYPPCQFGLAIFRPAPVLGDAFPEGDRLATWEVLPFNFNLFPKAVYQSNSKQFPMRDAVFSMQSSSAEFLYRNHFDFNKMFGHSVSWLRKDQEASVRAEIVAERPTAERSAQRIELGSLSDNDQAFVARLSDALLARFGPPKPEPVVPEGIKALAFDALEKDSGETTAGTAKGVEDRGDGLADANDILMCTRHENSMVRRYVYDMLKDNYPWLAVRQVCDMHERGAPLLRLQAMRSPAHARQANEANRLKETNNAIDRRLRASVGFRYVIDALLESRVPLIAHNALHDLCKTYANFIDTLPRELPAFKAALHSVFPHIVDTKCVLEHCARTVPWIENVMKAKKYDGQSALENLSDRLDEKFVENGIEKVRIRFFADPDGDAHGWLYNEFRRFGNLNASEFRHQADYDAFVTGKVFIQLCSVLVGEHYDPRDTALGTIMTRLLGHPEVAPLINRIALPSCGGYTFLHLGVEDPAADEENSFLGRDDVIVLRGMQDYAKRRGVTDPLGHDDILRYADEVLAGSVFHATRINRRFLHEEDGLLIILEPRPRSAVPGPIVGEACLDGVNLTTVAGQAAQVGTMDACVSDEMKPVQSVASGEKRKREGAWAPIQDASIRMGFPSDEERARGLECIRSKARSMGIVVMTYSEALQLPREKRRLRDVLRESAGR